MKTIHRLILALFPLLAILSAHAQGATGTHFKFTAPTPNQRWSNAVFTVTGTCFVTNDLWKNQVFILISTDGFATSVNASSSDDSSNWTAQVVLTPGSNTISAEVEADPDSPIQLGTFLVNMDYIVSATLTVRTNGGGGISPPDNGATLQVGATYEMTAKADKGSAFTDWTDGGGNVITNGATLKFIMASNLTYVANFADLTPPALTITAPKTGTKSSNDLVTVIGTATDNVAVSNVLYSVNGGAPATASLSNTTWRASVTLAAGTNTITAYAVDTSGNHSTTSSIKLIYILSARVVVNIVGDGTLKQDLNGDFLAISNRYTMVATPAKGFGFYYWNVGGAMSNSPTLDFTMVSNLVITANFRDITPPNISITTPKAGEKYSNSVITISGIASDNVGVMAVGVKLNNNDWVTANGTTIWSTNLTPVASGTNTILAYAMDAAGNLSATGEVKFLGVIPPDWAPTSLDGSTVLVTPNSGNPFTVSYDASTFNQTDTNEFGNSGVGSYIYLQTATNKAELSRTYNAPPGITNQGTYDIQYVFTSLDSGNFTNLDNAVWGTFSIEPAATLVPASWSGHKVTATKAGSTTPVTLAFSSSSDVTITKSGEASSTGTYVATDVSPIGAMVVVTYTSGPNVGTIAYIQFTFNTTKEGSYEINNYFTSNGGFSDGHLGTFTFK